MDPNQPETYNKEKEMITVTTENLGYPILQWKLLTTVCYSTAVQT